MLENDSTMSVSVSNYDRSFHYDMGYKQLRFPISMAISKAVRSMPSDCTKKIDVYPCLV